MIPAESRMREIRTSGSTSGGVETDRMGAGLSTKRKRGQEAPDPTRHRATPRLYQCNANTTLVIDGVLLPVRIVSAPISVAGN